MSEIESLRDSIPFWDHVVSFTAILLALGAVGPLVLEFGRLEFSESWTPRIRVASAVLVIVGTGGQIGAQIRISAISSEIVSILDERGRATAERTATLENNSKVLELNLETVRNENLRLRKTQTEQQKAISRRKIDPPQRQLFLDLTRNISSKLEQVVVVPDNDDDSERYGKDISELLRIAKFPVRVAEWHGLPPVKPGVTMCLRNPGDDRVFNALKQAKIAQTSVTFRRGNPRAPETQFEVREDFPPFCAVGSIFVGFRPAAP